MADGGGVYTSGTGRVLANNEHAKPSLTASGALIAKNSDDTAIGAAPLGAGTDRSGSITAGGTAQVLAAANTARVALVGQNIDPSEDMWINEVGGTALANAAGSTLVPAKATFSIDTNRAISVVAATTGHKWTAVEL
jgi:hypothetical protein